MTVRDVLGKDFPEIYCICGSGRFLDLIHALEISLTAQGKIVLSLSIDTHDVARSEKLRFLKPTLDRLHMHKIELADVVYIVNKDYYIGESTSKELDYARSLGKQIIFFTQDIPLSVI